MKSPILRLVVIAVLATVFVGQLMWRNRTPAAASASSVKRPELSPLQPSRYRRVYAINRLAGGHLALPGGICLGNRSDLFVSDKATCRVYRLSRDGKVISSFGRLGQGPGEFASPTALAQDSDGYLYVADTGNNRIQKLTADGAQVAVLRDHIERPSSVAIAGNGTLYIGSENANAESINRFDRSGAWLG